MLDTKIDSIIKVIAYIRYLDENKLIYHFEDDANDCISSFDDYTDEQLNELIDKLNIRTEEALNIAEKYETNLFAIMFATLEPLDSEFLLD